jgi:hypothetical protein
LDTVNVFISHNLKHRFAVRKFLQLDDCDVLAFIVRNHSLKDKYVNVFLLPVEYPDVINVSIPVQVKIVDLGIRRIKQFFKFFRRFRSLEEIQSSFKAEVITGHFCFL